MILHEGPTMQGGSDGYCYCYCRVLLLWMLRGNLKERLQTLHTTMPQQKATVIAWVSSYLHSRKLLMLSLFMYLFSRSI